jgi:hypothetical protein
MVRFVRLAMARMQMRQGEMRCDMEDSRLHLTHSPDKSGLPRRSTPFHGTGCLKGDRDRHSHTLLGPKDRPTKNHATEAS